VVEYAQQRGKKEEMRYIWKSKKERRRINGAEVIKVAKMIETALKKDYLYNPFCGRKIEEIKTEVPLLQCKDCYFSGICCPKGGETI